MGKTDPFNRALQLRSALSKDGKILVVKYDNTLQGKDTSRVIDIMPNVRTDDHVFRAKVNVKSLDPIAAVEYKKPFFDIRSRDDSAIESFIKNQEFDFPLWFKHSPEFSYKKVLDYNPPFIVQVGGCNFHDGTASGGCWYCFVDDISNDGNPVGKARLGVTDHIDSMINAREIVNRLYQSEGFDVNLKVARISGGEPTLILDYALNFWREIGNRGLDFVGQLDNNLSTGRVIDHFEKEGIYEKNILEKLAEYPVKVLTAIKGVTDENLAENVQSTATLETQLYSIKRFLKAGFDIYPQVYNPDPEHLWNYLVGMDSQIENFSLRAHIGPLSIYGPTRKRLTIEAKRIGVDPEEFIALKAELWKNNYDASTQIINDYLVSTYGVQYRDTVRSDVQLRILK